MSIYDAQRRQYIVVQWNREAQRGYIVESGIDYEYPVMQANLAPECEGQIAVGDLVSGISYETAVVDILIERGSNPIRERKEKESVGTNRTLTRETPGTGRICIGK
jgi:hypothetical protein